LIEIACPDLAHIGSWVVEEYGKWSYGHLIGSRDAPDFNPPLQTYLNQAPREEPWNVVTSLASSTLLAIEGYNWHRGQSAT
jgi:hypothetical protein